MLKTQSLTPNVHNIVIHKATERSCSGIYNHFPRSGTYLCRNCRFGLFKSQNKFDSGSGWPSFDQAIAGHIREIRDKDQVRTEVLCARCQAHLGHVFHGEGFTALDTRYCINSLALDFIEMQGVSDTEEAIVAAGCFWGVEYLFQQLSGVLKTEVGYTGGSVVNPNYEQVCQARTGHVEGIIIYDPSVIQYDQIIQYFFEIHDFTQQDGQGADIGPQYLSQIFYFNDKQLHHANKMIDRLKSKGYHVATSVHPVAPFWPAEDYHQRYYDKNGGVPYCHTRRQI